MLVSIYLNDHLAAATGAVELARRAAGQNRGREEGEFLAKLAQEVAEDRRSLREIMSVLEVAPDPVKMLAGWVAEKADRLQLNGRLRSYSPLSRLVELEVLASGCAARSRCGGRSCSWRPPRSVSTESSSLS